ncbi:MAG: cohesin domain-containing protein [Candidatus Methanogasteraceae archaeon]
MKRIAIIVLVLALSVSIAPHAAAEATVSVDCSDYASGSMFDVEIDISGVEELDSGQFCLLFDPNVLNVTDVAGGDIGGKDVTINNWVSVRCDTIQGIGIIKVVFNIASSTGVSGSGSLATIAFEVTGNDSDCSPLNITKPSTLQVTGFENGKLWDGETEEIFAVWVNSNACIGGSSRRAQTARVTVFVMNRDDDSLDVELSIDEVFKKGDKVSKNTKEEFSSYSLDEGTYEFKISWYDPDTDKTYEKHEEHSVSGTTALTLMTDEHTDEDNKISASVYVKNMDDDSLDVYLYLDSVYKKYKSISSGSVGDCGEYEFEIDENSLHLFKIEWLDPDTGINYEKVTREHITGEMAVTMYVDNHTAPEEIPTAVSTASAPPVSTPGLTRTPAQTAEIHTNPNPNSHLLSDTQPARSCAGDCAMEPEICGVCTLVAFVAVLFVLMQIRRI